MLINRRSMMLTAAFTAVQGKLPDAKSPYPTLASLGYFTNVSISGTNYIAQLDTGAESVIVDRALAELIGVSLRADISINNAGGQPIPTWTSDAIAINVLGRRVQINKPLYADVLSRSMGHEAIVLGYDILAAGIIEIDGRSQSARYIDAASPSRARSIMPIAPFGNEKHLRTLQIAVEGVKDITAVVDTGEQNGLRLSTALAKRVGLLDGRRTEDGYSDGGGSLRQHKMIRVQEVELGNVQVHNVSCIYEEWQDGGEHAYLGYDLLRSLTVQFDYQQSHLLIL